MIVLSRAAARSFRNLLRRSVMASAPRSIMPPVLAVAANGRLTLRSAHAEVGLTLCLPAPKDCCAQVAFPGELLARFEGAGDTQVVLEMLSPKKGQATWEERHVPQVAEFDAIQPAKVPALLPDVRRWTSLPPTFLQALDDACRTTSRDSARYSLQRILFRGSRGQLVATDGKQLLLQGGFPLPFAEDLAVLSLPVFGAKELAGADPVRIGHMDKRLVVQAGPWCIDLEIDIAARFPKLDSVIPSSPHPTRLVLDETDARFLIEALPGLPANNDELAGLTLDLGKEAVVRSRSAERAAELLLSASHVSGRPVRVSLDRKQVLRGLRMGFGTWEVHGLNKPLLARDGERMLVLAMLDPNSVVEGSAETVRIPSTPVSHSPAHPIDERKPTMTTSSNGNGRASEQPETLDPLIEADALRIALQEAHGRCTRLIAAMRQFRKQQKVVHSAMASLRQLQIAP